MCLKQYRLHGKAAIVGKFFQSQENEVKIQFKIACLDGSPLCGNEIKML
jgi:hypothetical protein